MECSSCPFRFYEYGWRRLGTASSSESIIIFEYVVSNCVRAPWSVWNLHTNFVEVVEVVAQRWRVLARPADESSAVRIHTACRHCGRWWLAVFTHESLHQIASHSADLTIVRIFRCLPSKLFGLMEKKPYGELATIKWNRLASKSQRGRTKFINTSNE